MIQFFGQHGWSESEFDAIDAPLVDIDVIVGEDPSVVYFVVKQKAFNKPLFKLKVNASDISRLLRLAPTLVGDFNGLDTSR